MLAVADRGSTRSGRQYLPDYIERILEERCSEFIEKLQRSDTTEISSLFADMTISPKKEKTLREYGAPSGIVAKSPILYPTNYAEEFSIDANLINEVKDNTFLGQEDEDPHALLTTFNALCGTFKLKVCPENLSYLNFLGGL